MISGHYVSGLILSRQLKIEGFTVLRWLSEWPTAFKQMAEWIKEVIFIFPCLPPLISYTLTLYSLFVCVFGLSSISLPLLLPLVY